MLNQKIEILEKSRKVYRVASERVRTDADAALIFDAVFHPAHDTQEAFFILFLSQDGEILGVSEASRGDGNHAVASPQLIFERAVPLRATRVIIAHTHPCGSLRPSKADWILTRRLRQACSSLGIQVVSHLILRNHTYASIDELAEAHHRDVTIPMDVLAAKHAHVIPELEPGEGVPQEIQCIDVRITCSRTEMPGVPSALRNERVASDAFAHAFHLGDADAEDDRLCIFFLDLDDNIVGAGQIQHVSRIPCFMIPSIIYGGAVLHGARAVAIAECTAGKLMFPAKAEHRSIRHVINTGRRLDIYLAEYFLFGCNEYVSIPRFLERMKKHGKKDEREEIFNALRCPARSENRRPKLP